MHYASVVFSSPLLNHDELREILEVQSLALSARLLRFVLSNCMLGCLAACRRLRPACPDLETDDNFSHFPRAFPFVNSHGRSPTVVNARYYDPAFAVKLTVGPTLGLGVVSCYLGTAGAAFTLCLRRRATSDRDGPIRAYLNRNSSGVNFAPPPPAGVPPTAGAA